MIIEGYILLIIVLVSDEVNSVRFTTGNAAEEMNGGKRCDVRLCYKLGKGITRYKTGDYKDKMAKSLKKKKLKNWLQRVLEKCSGKS